MELVPTASAPPEAPALSVSLARCLDAMRRSLETRLADAPAGDIVREYFGRGKMLRAHLVFAAAAAVGGRPEEVVAAAEAIELLHGASLIHDDIIDGAAERRGLPALHVRLGLGPALVLGDELILRALAVLSEAHATHATARVLESADALNAAARECCRGQFEELRADRWVPEMQYLDIVASKTAAAFVAAGALGAVLGGGTAAAVARIRTYARQFGIGFQIGDDLLDLIGEARVLGKPVGNSLARGRPMFPLIELRSLCSDRDRSDLERLDSSETLAALLDRYAIVERVRHRQQMYLDEASAALDGLPGTAGVEALRAMCGLAAARLEAMPTSLRS